MRNELEAAVDKKAAERIEDLEAQTAAAGMALPGLLSLIGRVCDAVLEAPVTLEEEHVACALAQVALMARKRKVSASLKAQKADAPKKARK